MTEGLENWMQQVQTVQQVEVLHWCQEKPGSQFILDMVYFPIRSLLRSSHAADSLPPYLLLLLLLLQTFSCLLSPDGAILLDNKPQ